MKDIVSALVDVLLEVGEATRGHRAWTRHTDTRLLYSLRSPRYQQFYLVFDETHCATIPAETEKNAKFERQFHRMKKKYNKLKRVTQAPKTTRAQEDANLDSEEESSGELSVESEERSDDEAGVGSFDSQVSNAAHL